MRAFYELRKQQFLNAPLTRVSEITYSNFEVADVVKSILPLNVLDVGKGRKQPQKDLKYLLLLWFIFATTSAKHNCDKNSTKSFGYLSSHNFPAQPTSQNVICRYRLIAPPGNLIQITFLSHPDLTSSDDCYHGSLRIYEGEGHGRALDTQSVQYCSSRKACHKTYLSNGASLLLIYTSTYSYVRFMFKLVYRHTSGNNLVYDNTEGLIYSPNFMSKLLNQSEEYTYRIEADAGMQVYLSFSYINFPDDVHCLMTSLYIYEGVNATGSPVERRCGRISTNFVSASNSVTLKYKTNLSFAGLPSDHGFIVYYSTGTSEYNRIYNSSSGAIYSPLFPCKYPNNTEYKYDITVEQGNMIYLDPTVFFLREGDIVQIFEMDHSNNHFKLRTRLTTIRPYYSMSSRLRVKFISNGIHNSKGFKLQYIATKGCSLNLTNIPSYIVSPSYPLNYPSSLRCNYTLKYSPAGYVFPAIRFVDIDIKDSKSCCEDSLSVYDKTNGSPLLLDRFCGMKAPRTYMTSGDTLFVQFKSTNGSMRRGFKAVFHRLYSYCKKEYHSGGSITSPNYPFKYPNNTSCKQYITGGSRSTIILKMQHFDLEASKNCIRDSLKIYEGAFSSKTLMSTRCGNDMTQYISKSNAVSLVFSSNSKVSLTGYRIRFTICGGNYPHYYGLYDIKSPWYPESYTSNLVCRYMLYGRFDNYGVRLLFKSFEIEDSPGCRNDNFTMYEGKTTNSTIAAVKCGSVTGDYFSNSQNLLLVFRSNSEISGKGYHINVETCSKLFTAETGTITSPGFPSRHPEDIFCTYAVRLAMGAKLKIIVQNFSLVNDHTIHYLKIYDGRDSSAPVVATMRGSKYPATLSTGNEVFIEFNFHEYPPNDRNWYGFKLVYFDNQGFCSKQKPCKNNSTCIDIFDNDYKCTCTGDYTGNNCTEKIALCNSKACLDEGFCSKFAPCKNNATCINLSGEYKCNCTMDYTGRNCSERIAPCRSNPCLNNGTSQHTKAKDLNTTLIASLSIGLIALFALTFIIIVWKLIKKQRKGDSLIKQPFMHANDFNNEAFEEIQL